MNADDTEILQPEPSQFQPGEVIASRYRIRRYIARGGMGEVYEAEDLDLEVIVAVKTLRTAVVAGDLRLSRFKREIDLARRVTHPNIGRIFDIGHHTRPGGDEVPFLTMEFLSGETLAQRIARLGPIPRPEMLPLTLDMVRALDAIHRNGIVHRDFKSSNVMLIAQPGQSDCARVMDFGLARPANAGDFTFTQSGFISGTPVYMAPEQFENISTPASDIYSLGIVLHEMLTGTRPHVRTGSTTAAAPALGTEWAPVVRRCLALNPADRFQNAGELLELLLGSNTSATPLTATPPPRSRPGLWIIASICAMIIAIASFTWPRTQPIIRGSSAPTHLALLPIISESADPADAAFCAGFSDTVRGDLAGMETGSKNALWVVPSVEVRGITSPSQAYREVGANLVLVVTFHRQTSGVSLSTELVDAQNRHLLKASAVSVPSLPALRQAAITQIASLLDVSVPDAASREMVDSSTTEPGAFEYYEQGRGYLQENDLQSLNHAIELFRKAFAKDPAFTLAYAGLGEAYAAKYELTKDPQWIQQAVANGKKAIGLNGGLAQVHSTMGEIYRMTGHSDLAITELKRAIEIQPACLSCYHHLGDAYLDRGQLADAERSFALILREQRGDVQGYSGLGKVADMRGDLPKAAAMYKQALDLAPDRATEAANLGGVYVEMGRYAEAVPLLQKALTQQPSDQTYSNLGGALMLLGRFPEAVDAMQHAVKLAPLNHDCWRNLGDSYRQVPALRGQANGAYLKALERARAALAVKPGDPDLLSSIGLYSAHLGDNRKSAAFTAEALLKAPGNSSVLFTAALANELTGQRKKALINLAAAAKAGYPLSLIEKEPELFALHADPNYRTWIDQVKTSSAGSH